MDLTLLTTNLFFSSTGRQTEMALQIARVFYNVCSYIQQDLFGEIEKDEKQEKIETSVYEVRKKFGMDSIKSGTVIKSEE